MKASRSRSTILNSSILTLVQIFTVLVKFITQTIFIKYLGKEFLGLNGLFTNVLSVLSFAELGVGSAIVFSLYGPLAKNDEASVSALMNLFKKAYDAIGIIIAVAGMVMIPILPVLIKDYSSLNSVTYYFVLYLTNSVVSYFFTYKRSLLIADQKEYISALNQLKYTAVQVVLQVTVLFLFHSYAYYLWVAIICTVLSNFTMSRKVDRLYPYLNKNKNLKVNRNEIHHLRNNIAGMVGSKIGSIVVRSTDNLLLSAFMGITVVGIYSNYLLIVTSISNILSKLTSSVTASVGNLIVENNQKKAFQVYSAHFMINFFIVSISAGCLYVSLNPFIKFWAGESYALSLPVVVIVVLNYFFDQLRQSSITFISAYGLFVPNGKKSVIEAILNFVLSLSLLLVFHLGIRGVLLGTILTNLFLNSWWEPLLLFRLGFGFKKKYLRFYVFNYVLNSVFVILVVFVISKAILYLDQFMFQSNLFIAFLNSLIMIFFMVVFFSVFYSKTTGYKYIVLFLKKIFRNN